MRQLYYSINAGLECGNQIPLEGQGGGRVHSQKSRGGWTTDLSGRSALCPSSQATASIPSAL